MGFLQLTTEEEIGMPVEFVGADDPSLGKQFSTTALACAFLGCPPADLGSAVLSQSEVWTAIKNNKNNLFSSGFFHFEKAINSYGNVDGANREPSASVLEGRNGSGQAWKSIA